MRAGNQQLDLINPEPPVSVIHLEAVESAKQAYYTVSVYTLPNGAGYRIQKTSGPKGGKANIEQWWSPSYKDALKKQGKLIAAKTKLGRKGRIYTVRKHDE